MWKISNEIKLKKNKESHNLKKNQDSNTESPNTTADIKKSFICGQSQQWFF